MTYILYEQTKSKRSFWPLLSKVSTLWQLHRVPLWSQAHTHTRNCCNLKWTHLFCSSKNSILWVLITTKCCSILGVTNTCSDDDIKKYYKRQAVLVHPDKNSQPGAEEAFKILVHAFELIGEPVSAVLCVFLLLLVLLKLS